MIRAVVFDLDDTLVDTSGQLLVPAHTEAAAAMIAAGLPGTLEEVTQKRLDLSRAHPREPADVRVAQFYGVTDVAVVEAGHNAFYRRTVRALDPFPDAIPVLEELGARGLLRLMVTAGFERTQLTKLKLAGLDAHLDTIVVVDAHKEEAIAALLDEHALQPPHVVVVGDRIDREIAAARRLGCWAVRVAHGEGRYARVNAPEERPHYTIPGVAALLAVLEDIVLTAQDPTL